MGVVSKTRLLAFWALFFFGPVTFLALNCCWFADHAAPRLKKGPFLKVPLVERTYTHIIFTELHLDQSQVSLFILVTIGYQLATSWYIKLIRRFTCFTTCPVRIGLRSAQVISWHISGSFSSTVARACARACAWYVCLFLQNHYCGYCRRVLSMVSKWFLLHVVLDQHPERLMFLEPDDHGCQTWEGATMASCHPVSISTSDCVK